LTTLMKMALVNALPDLNTDDLQKMELMQFSEMNLIDTDDCGKKMLCELARKEKLTWDERHLLSYFNNPVNFTSDALFFNIAVQVGKERERECESVYQSCFLNLSEMLKIIRREGISVEVPGDELKLEVNFNWRKKSKSSENIPTSNRPAETEQLEKKLGQNLTETYPDSTNETSTVLFDELHFLMDEHDSSNSVIKKLTKNSEHGIDKADDAIKVKDKLEKIAITQNGLSQKEDARNLRGRILQKIEEQHTDPDSESNIFQTRRKSNEDIFESDGDQSILSTSALGSLLGGIIGGFYGIYQALS